MDAGSIRNPEDRAEISRVFYTVEDKEKRGLLLLLGQMEKLLKRGIPFLLHFSGNPLVTLFETEVEKVPANDMEGDTTGFSLSCDFLYEPVPYL